MNGASNGIEILKKNWNELFRWTLFSFYFCVFLDEFNEERNKIFCSMIFFDWFRIELIVDLFVETTFHFEKTIKDRQRSSLLMNVGVSTDELVEIRLRKNFEENLSFFGRIHGVD